MKVLSIIFVLTCVIYIAYHVSFQQASFPTETNQQNNAQTMHKKAITLSSYSSITLAVTLTNKYDDNFELYPFDYIAATYLQTTYTVTPSIEQSGVTFKWVIDDNTYVGQQVNHQFNSTGWKSLKVSMLDSDDSTLLASTSISIMSRYVRRELRSLTSEDLDAVLTAIQIMYYLPTLEGKEIYGESYRGIESFLVDHLNGAAQKVCDHWHDDSGIMVHHIAFTLDFENSLRVIDPTVSVPFWEYTIDAYLYSTDWEESPIFNDYWFGVASPNNSAHIITEGRWAYLPVFSDASTISSIYNPYNLLRSPWNLNSVPYVTRHDQVLGETTFTSFPGCSDFASAFNSTWIGELNNYLNGGLHGPVHIMIGGHWNELLSLSKYEDIMEYFTLSADVLLYAKNLWRLGYARCPSTCSSDDEESCFCYCPTSLRQGMTAYELLNITGQLSYMVSGSTYFKYNPETGRYFIKDKTSSEENEILETMLDLICSFGYAGEMFSSAAPYDPTFWIIHTSAERFLQYRRFSSYYGSNDLNETWGYDHSISAPSDFGKVCDWDGVGDDDLPICSEDTCFEHHKNDELPETNMVSGFATFTNQEFYEIMDPRSEDLPYVYENFNWDHCTLQGITFNF